MIIIFWKSAKKFYDISCALLISIHILYKYDTIVLMRFLMNNNTPIFFEK